MGLKVLGGVFRRDGCLIQSLGQISDNVVNVFYTHRQTYIAISNTSRQLLLRRQLWVGCRGRMNSQAARIANVSHVIE